MSHDHDHEGEPIPGLPALPPPGEEILWQGAPDWKLLARRAFHVRALAAWFGFFVAARFLAALVDGKGAAESALSAIAVLPLAALGLGLVTLLAWLNAKSALYTITSKRVVMRFGVALQMSFNVPFRQVGAALLKQYPDGTGDIALELLGEDRFAWLHLWPHARPWRFSRAQPMLRALPEVQKVAAVLARAAGSRPKPAAQVVPLLAAAGGQR